ncbi:50S ribosomal protein L22 [Verrucomicrobiota bacterium]
MEVTATARFVRASPSKVRPVARLVHGRSVDDALKVTEFGKQKAAVLIGRTLRSAIANAQSNDEMSSGELRVKEAIVDEGPRLKRYWSRARGTVRPIQKRTCHIRIVLTDEPD